MDDSKYQPGSDTPERENPDSLDEKYSSNEKKSDAQDVFDQSPYSRTSYTKSMDSQGDSYDQSAYTRGAEASAPQSPPKQVSVGQASAKQASYQQAPPPPNPPQGPPPPSQNVPSQGGFIHSPGPSATSITSLVLGILSWLGFSIFTAIPGLILARMELNKIKRGETSEEGRIYAQIGFWFSLIHVAMIILGLALGCCFWGALSTMFGGVFLEMSNSGPNTI